MEKSLDYGSIMNTAMKGFVRDVLAIVAKDGLPGEHHFFITLDTTHPDLEMADWLKERYPDTITIVMQYWFDNLEVAEQGFSVTLNFNDLPEPLFVPYEAILTFVDPSVEFGVKFERTQDEAVESDPATDKEVSALDAMDGENDADIGVSEADVVQLDRFRKPKKDA